MCYNYLYPKACLPWQGMCSSIHQSHYPWPISLPGWLVLCRIVERCMTTSCMFPAFQHKSSPINSRFKELTLQVMSIECTTPLNCPSWLIPQPGNGTKIPPVSVKLPTGTPSAFRACKSAPSNAWKLSELVLSLRNWIRVVQYQPPCCSAPEDLPGRLWVMCRCSPKWDPSLVR